MKKLLCFILSAIMLTTTSVVFADEFSDNADIDYSYNKSYDEMKVISEETSKQYDDINTSYDADYDETSNGYYGYGEEIEEPVNNNKAEKPVYNNNKAEEPVNNNKVETPVHNDIQNRKNTDDGIKVYLNGNPVKFDVEPMIINDRTMVPMRAIFEAFGADVSWNGITRTATGKHNGITVEITIGENNIYKNGESISLDSPATIINDRTLVPVRAIAESFECVVEWQERTKSVYIIGY